jgi:hypothetical protein
VSTKNKFKVGDWADHKSGTLDPREVARVEGDSIYLRFSSQNKEYGPFLAANYRRIPKDKS